MPCIKPLCTAALTATIAMAASPHAGAEVIQRQAYQNGGSACTGALPTYEGALRKRPRAIVNEGSNVAFVTCSAVNEEITAMKATFAYLRLSNAGTSPVQVTCTFVNASDWEGGVSTPSAVTVPAGGASQLSWGSIAADAEVFPYLGVNFSCALPPGVGVSYVGKRWKQDVGAL